VRIRLLRSLFTLLVAVAGTAAYATSFVVPPDRDLIRRADAVVIGRALSSYTRLTPQNTIETVTVLSIEESIKGEATGIVNIVEPGGQFGSRATILAGVPRFEEGKRMLLLLLRTGVDRWAVSELVLGKFKFETDINGQALLVRDDAEIAGWDPDLQVHREQHRLAGRFLNFVRAEAGAQMAPADYWTEVAPLRIQTNPTTKSTSPRVPVPAVAPFTANSYTMFISGSAGGRWAVFPSPVSWFSGTTQEPGAPGGGVTAIQAAFASWDNDCGSNVNYVYAGVDDGTHTQGLHGVDNRNTVLFERDLSSWGVAPFTCSGNSYSGTLGIGGVTSASGTNTVNGETFATTSEGDVEMNRGIANCTLLFNNGDFNSAVTHEIGHTLGFRHSDQDRSSSGACTSDPSLECSNQAIMKSFISTGLNAALQAWDQHAVQAVYPGNVCAPGGCTAPAITQQPASSTIPPGGGVTLSVSASGTAPVSYQWYIGTSGNTASPVPGGTGPQLVATPSTTTNYWVRASNSCGSANSNTATVTVNNACTAPVITQQPASSTIPPGGGVTLSVSASGTAPLSYQWYIGTSGNTASPVSGGTGPQLVATPSTTTNYWVRVSNSCGSVNSNTATVTVAASCTAPAVTQQPSSSTITAGGGVTLSVSASGTAPLSYQWYIGTSGNTASPVSGGTGPQLVATPATTTDYWVRVSNSCGSVNSATATVTVVPAGGVASSFYLVNPCRIIDTRNPNSPGGGPNLGPGQVRNINVAGVCSISPQAKSLAVNVTVVSASASGYLVLYPGPASAGVPGVSTINYTTRVLANNAIIRVGNDGTINVYNSGPSTVSFIIDVSGYFQ
jgi:hypothetical protein